ncbi:MAG: glycosyltransferase [Geitlerinemataceae cyanobacterium]
MNTAEIFFYSPHFPDDLANLPESVNESWDWFYDVGRPKLDITDGEYAWIFQTYIYLKSRGFNCTATRVMPTNGIVFVHRNFLPFLQLPERDQLFVCVQADKAPHPFSQASVVLTEAGRYLRWAHRMSFTNPPVLWRQRKPYRNRFYIKHWPVPNLKPRDPARGSTVKNVAYMGVAHSLAPELQTEAWRDALERSGFSWIWKKGWSRSDWTDFSEIDVIVAVRSFETQKHEWASKPPTKLFNAWLAGAIPIIGSEASVREVGNPGVDYIEVNSEPEVLAALERLRDDKDFRAKLLAAGREKAREISVDAICSDWMELVARLQNEHKRWSQQSAVFRGAFYLRSCFRIAFDKIFHTISHRRK